MFKRNLLFIEEELNKIRQSDVMKTSVETKLNDSLNNYVKNLEDTWKYLSEQDPETIEKYLRLKKRIKRQQEREKKADEE